MPGKGPTSERICLQWEGPVTLFGVFIRLRLNTLQLVEAKRRSRQIGAAGMKGRGAPPKLGRAPVLRSSLSILRSSLLRRTGYGGWKDGLATTQFRSDTPQPAAVSFIRKCRK